MMLGLTVSGGLVTTVDGSMAVFRLDSIVLRLGGIAVMRLDSIALRLSGIAVMVATLRLSNSCQATTVGLCETSTSFMEFGGAGVASTKALSEA